MNKTAAFISLKDHKPDFENNHKCHLINPAKSISILDNINNWIRIQTQVNQWQSSTNAILWFQSIQNKPRKSFTSFDIVDFYPSISEHLMDWCIAWGKQFINITDSDISITKHARKSLLSHQNQIWSKRNADNTFDITMGSYDRAEICELVGLIILNSLQECLRKNVGLYRNDSLAVINTKSGRLCDKERNFLDLTFNLTNGTEKPYRKLNNEPLHQPLIKPPTLHNMRTLQIYKPTN